MTTWARNGALYRATRCSTGCIGRSGCEPSAKRLRAGSAGKGDPSRDRRRLAQGLQHDAVALGQLQQRVHPVLRLIGVEVEGEADVAEADRRRPIDAERTAEVEIAFGAHLAA